LKITPKLDLSVKFKSARRGTSNILFKF